MNDEAGRLKKESGLRTNAFLKLYPSNEHSWMGAVTISFGYPHHGWIQMAVSCTAFVQGVIVHISAVFDPFPEFIRWLENIVAGNLPSEFIIDEEGYGKRFRATAVNEKEFLFEIAEWLWDKKKVTEEPLYLYVQASRQQVIAEFLKRWDDFIQNQYDPQHWQESGADLRLLNVEKLRESLEKFLG